MRGGATARREVSMSEIVKEKPIMEEVQKKYNNFVKSRLMMMNMKRKRHIYTAIK